MDGSKIIEGIKAGDKNSFDELYDKYYLMLFRTAYLILGNSYDAEDVTQDAFVSIYVNIKSLKDPDKLKPWMFSILKNSAYKKYKNKKRELPDEEIQLKVDKETYTIEDEFVVKSEIQDALMSLNKKQREVIVLFYYNDLTIKEIASALGVFEGTVKSRLFKARKVLKKELEHSNESFLIEREGIYEKRLESKF
ncbi:RNA polymerase sigma factor [Peptoniphilus sp.]|uniref:RNA polymerase sigma factor n=1 Tax=Peptoniphilus sp. TaxID=1971214 RepID=UPI003D93A5ED